MKRAEDYPPEYRPSGWETYRIRSWMALAIVFSSIFFTALLILIAGPAGVLGIPIGILIGWRLRVYLSARATERNYRTAKAFEKQEEEERGGPLPRS